MALNKTNRLKNKKDFDLVFQKGKTARGNLFFIKFADNDLHASRFGFVIAAKAARKAVARNRIRRILAEVVSKNWNHIAKKIDVVIVAIAKMDAKLKPEIVEDFTKILIKGGILKND